MSLENEILTKWMQWKEIVPYREQLVDFEIILMKKYHYPDMDIPREYCMRSVDNLKTHLENGNTFFWGITKNETLLGYYWAYTAPFINKKRWILRSLMICEDYHGLGLGTLAMEVGKAKAKEQGCDEMVTHYVPWNQSVAKLYEKAGFEVCRIEVVNDLTKE